MAESINIWILVCGIKILSILVKSLFIGENGMKVAKAEFYQG